jgi:hypothetical protein
MQGVADYILGGLLLIGVLNCVTIAFAMAIHAKIAKQERLIEFINSRAMKAKQLEEHREKVEEQRVSKLKKPRNGRK